MSKNEKEQKMTKYDLKKQKRDEEKAKEKREERVGMITLVVLVLAVVCFIASFPIRKYMAVNEEVVTVDGQAVSRVEFDYNYNIMANSYINTYGTLMSNFGIDLSGDLSTQMYSETMTWEDYFQQMAVDSICQNKAMLNAAEAEGFTYDTTEEWNTFKTSVESAASEAGVSENEYLQTTYGQFATLSRLEPYIKNAILANAYYEVLAERNAATDDEVLAYYEENKDYYDCVDYRVTMVSADVTEESTEEQITAAMATAKEEADKAVETVAQDGELQSGMTIDYTSYVINGWLFDEARVAGDTTVIEDEDEYQYYVLAFEDRYRDDSPTVDVRVIITGEDGQAIVDEWNAGEATEDSFIELCATYSVDTSTSANGGLYQGMSKSGMAESLADWMFAEERAYGDVAALTTEDGYNYVMFFVGSNEPIWKVSIQDTLVTERLSAYVDEITSAIEVVDSKKNLNYLWVGEAEATETVESTEAATETTQAAN